MSWNVRLPEETGSLEGLTEDETKVFLRTVARILATENILLPPDPIKPWLWDWDLVKDYERCVMIPGGAKRNNVVPYNLRQYRKLGRYAQAVASALEAEGRLGEDGKPLWRVAPMPHGRYWDEGMKVGYQDAGSWTIPRNVKGRQRAMAWLWAQFCISKTVSLEKFIAGGTPVRKSTIFADYVTERMNEYGGLIEFLRSPEEKKWTDTGLNVPDYPKLAALWWPIS